MLAEQNFCFKIKGDPVYLFTLRNAQGTEVCISNYGAIITSFKIKKKDNSINDIVLGFDSIEEYVSPDYLRNNSYIGAACGRYANRIKNGHIQIDGISYQLTQNAGENQLHGGMEGFDRKIWQLVSSNSNSLELTYLSKDGEEGFPGNLKTRLRFELNDQNELSYEYFATTDKVTAVNLTHHSYFNLNNGTGTIENHEVRIYGSNILSQDEGFVCNGTITPVANTAFDFGNFKTVNSDWDKIGYDQCFIIDNKTNELRLVAETRSLQSGIHLQLFSTEPAVQFYTSQSLPVIKGKNENKYGPFSGLCLETHKYPNAINIPHFPNTVLKPGELYYQKNVYRVSALDVK